MSQQSSQLPRLDGELLRRFRSFLTDLVGMSGPQGGDLPPRDIWDRVLFLIEKHSSGLVRPGAAFEIETERELAYLMAVTADEQMLNRDWPGRAFWSENLVEERLFGTHRAGDEFFARIDRIVERRDPPYDQLAIAYLTAIGTGFEGKYRGSFDRSVLDRYRRKLYEYLFDYAPEWSAAVSQLSPQAYGHTLSSLTPRKLSNPWLWFFSIPIVLVVWILLSHVVWLNLSSSLNDTLGRIREKVTVAVRTGKN